MAEQTYTFEDFWGGFSTEPIESKDLGQMLDLQNFRVNRQGYIEPRVGYSKLSTGDLGGSVLGLGYHYDGTGAGTPSFVAVSATGKLYTAPNNVASPSWSQKVAGLSPYYLWRFFEFDSSANVPLLIGLNGFDHPQKITGVPAVTDLGGSPPHSLAGFQYKNRMWLSHATRPTWNYSDDGNPESGWTNYIAIPAGSNERIQGAAYSGSVPITFLYDSIWALFGGTPSEFGWAQKTNIGCSSPHSIAGDGLNIFFVSTGGHIMKYSYGAGIENIGRPVEKYLYDLNDVIVNVRGFWEPANREYWLSIPNAAGGPVTLVYDERGLWWKCTIPMQSAIYIERLGVSSQTTNGQTIMGLSNTNFVYKYNPATATPTTQDDGVDIVTKVRTPWTRFGQSGATKTNTFMNAIGRASAATSITANAYYRNIPRGTATTLTATATGATLPRMFRLPAYGIEAREWSFELVADQKVTIDALEVGMEITGFDKEEQ